MEGKCTFQERSQEADGPGCCVVQRLLLHAAQEVKLAQREAASLAPSDF